MASNVSKHSIKVVQTAYMALVFFLELDMPLIFVMEKSDSEGENHLSFSC